MADDPREAPQRLLDLGEGLAIWRVHVDDLAEQPLNARGMADDMFGRLKETIGSGKRLESLPFVAMYVMDEGAEPRFEIVSGHHRVRAARAAELWYIHVIADETALPSDTVKAKQLAHNSIAGEDEPQLIARIYASISDVDARLEAFIFEQPADTAPPSVKLPNMDLDLGYRVITLAFLPHQADEFEHAIGQLAEDGALTDDVSVLALVDRSMLEQWQKAANRFRREFDARAVSVQMHRMMTAACQQLGIEQDADTDPEDWVALTDVLKSAVVPPDVAKVLGDAVKAAIKNGDADKKTPWKALTALAENYTKDRS